jgi:heat shock protein HslJ
MGPSILILLSALIAISSAACQNGDGRDVTSAEPSGAGSKQSTAELSSKSNADAELLDTPWRIIWLDGKPFAAEDVSKPAEVTFDEKEQRVHGTSGCNRFFGTYSLQGSSLSLSQMGATRMACAKGMDKEQQILTALGETGRFEIADSTLELYDKKDQLRIKLVAAAAKVPPTKAP